MRQTKRTCSDCGGDGLLETAGKDDRTRTVKCHHCNGKGYILDWVDTNPVINNGGSYD